MRLKRKVKGEGVAEGGVLKEQSGYSTRVEEDKSLLVAEVRE